MRGAGGRSPSGGSAEGPSEEGHCGIYVSVCVCGGGLL